MKDKPIVIIITLLAGLVACICCIIKSAGLLATLLSVLISMIIFLIIGQIVNSIIAKQDRIAKERAKALEAQALTGTEPQTEKTVE